MTRISRYLIALAPLVGCSGFVEPPQKGVGAPTSIFEPYSGADARIEGVAASNGEILVIVSAQRPDGIVAYAQRFDVAGAPLGTTFLDTSFFPNDIHDLRYPSLHVVPTASGWGFVDADNASAGFIDPQGNVTTQAISNAQYSIGLAATSTGLAGFRGGCGTPTCIARDDIAPNAPVVSQTIAQLPSASQQILGLELAPSGGFIASLSQTDWTVSVLPLDASGTPVGPWTLGPVAAVASKPLNFERFVFAGGASRGSDHALLLVRPGDAGVRTFELFIVKGDGTIAESNVIDGAPFGLVATQAGYRVATECNLAGCFLEFDADGKQTGQTKLDPRDADHPTFGLPFIVDDGAGGRAVAFVDEPRGLLARIASLDDATHWVDGWRVPGSVLAMNVRTSPAGTLAEVTPWASDGNSNRTTWAIPLDATGAPQQASAETFFDIVAPTPSGFLGRGFDASLLLLDPTASVVSTIPMTTTINAAVWVDQHAIVALDTGSFSVVTPDGAVTPTTTPAAPSFFARQFCPEASDGVVLVEGTGSNGELARRMAFDASWVDPDFVGLSAVAPMPGTSDCWTCGASCWVLVSTTGAITRVDATTGTLAATSLATLPSGLTRAAGDVDGGLAIVRDANDSLTLHVLDSLGAPTGESWPIPDATMPTTSFMVRRFGIGSLGANRFVVLGVEAEADGTERAVRRIVQL